MRALMVGTGCRGLQLARDLVAEGHAVRAVTRDEGRRGEIEAAGCECWIGDPDRIGTLRYALENVTVLLWLLGTADGPDPEKVAALHGSRLKMMLEKTTDTTVRGVLYEANGPHAESGTAEVRWAAERNEIPYRLLTTPAAEQDRWVAEARRAIDELLTATRGPAAG